MIVRVFILTILSTSVLSLPVTSGQLENEDVKVMKCIVEALADVLSRPHPLPVSQDCLLTLKTDDRLVTILRHHNFLRELQELAVQGGQKRAQEEVPVQVTLNQIADADTPDRSMLEALGGPGERSILSQKKGMGSEEGEEVGKVEGSDEAEEKELHEKLEDSARSLVPESGEDWSETEKKNHEEKNNEKRGHKDKKGSEQNKKRDSTRNKSKEEEEEEKDKRSSLQPHKQEDNEGEVKRSGLKLWSKRAKGLQMKKKETPQEEVPHHSKEVTNENEEAEKRSDPQRSPEEKELQMIARGAPEERKGSDEEGSGSRKEPEIESLATIESELESVAQKLHELSGADRRQKRG